MGGLVWRGREERREEREREHCREEREGEILGLTGKAPMMRQSCNLGTV